MRDTLRTCCFLNTVNPTKEIWYYEHPLPPDRRQLKNPRYTQTKPLVYEEFEPLLEWWNNRHDNDYAWRVLIQEIQKNDLNLDIHHPKHAGGQAIRSIGEVKRTLTRRLDTVVHQTNEVLEILANVDGMFRFEHPHELKTLIELGIEINSENRNPSRTNPHDVFQYIDLSSVSFNNIDNVKMLVGGDAPARARRVVREHDVILATVRPYLRGHAVIPAEFDNEICSTGFAVLRCPPTLHPTFLYYMLISPNVIAQYLQSMRGAHYPALNEKHVKAIVVPALPYEETD